MANGFDNQWLRIVSMIIFAGYVAAVNTWDRSIETRQSASF
jgi:hypothetical protein